jgi:hypothetical protein
MKDAPERIASRLNDLLEKDPKAVQSLLENRVPTNRAVAESESFVVTADGTDEGYENPRIGLLGVLNGLVGPSHVIEAVLEEDGSVREFRARPFET